MKVFFDSRQSVKSNDSFSPSAQKSGELAKQWKDRQLPVSIEPFRPAARRDLYRVHDRSYVDGVLDLQRANGYGNKSEAVAKSLPWVVGSFLSAVKHSIETGENSWSLTSGAHHAHYTHGGGFCTFNFLMLGALLAVEMGSRRTVLLDFDRHDPDGCRDIQERIEVQSLEIYSFGEQPIRNVSDSERWLANLPSTLLGLCDGADLILYNAGVDPAETDPLGGVMTKDQMRRRDRLVFETALAFDAPVSVSLAGGYSKDADGSIQPTLDLHTQTLVECLSVSSVLKRRELL